MSNFPDVLYVLEARGDSERNYEYKRARQMAHTTVYRKDRLHLRFKIIVFLERLYDPIICYSFYLHFFFKKVSRAGKYACQISFKKVFAKYL